MSSRPIIVFDSGLGGQSIYRPLKDMLPGHHLLYLDAHENFPYGNKSPAWLSARIKTLGHEFAILNPLLVVLACNTATVNAIDILRQRLACPVVGVEPVLKPLASFTHALALMTSSSARAVKTSHLLKQFGTHVQIYTPLGLAEAIEYNDVEQVKKSIHEIKILVQTHHIQAVGLSCTHYSLILTDLQKAMPHVQFIDPSMAVVKEVLRVLRLEEHE